MNKLPKLNLQLKNPLKNMTKNKKILLIVIAVILIAVIAFIASFLFKRSRMKEHMEKAFVTETAQIERQTLSNSISATGTVTSAETKTVNTSLKDLEVVTVYVKEGDYVEEGTIICEFDSSDYEEELAKAQNNQSVNEQIDALDGDYTTAYTEAIENAEAGLENVREARDDAKEAYQEASESESAAKSAYESALANYNTVKDNEATLSEEYTAAADSLKTSKADYDAISKGCIHGSEDAASCQTCQEVIENYNTAKNTYESAQKALSDFNGVKTSYEQASENYNSAKQAAEQAKAAYEQAQAKREEYQDTYENAVEKAQEDYDKAALESQLITETQEEKTINEYTELIDDCVVKASMSGVITSLNVTEGNVFEGGDVYTIQDNEHFIVSASVDEYDISSIEKGMSVYIKTDATGDVEMTGEVTYVAIAPSSSGAMGAISNSASYTIEVTIDEADENLRAGMTAKISIALEESEDALTVPYDAVTKAPDGTSTITVDVNGEKKTITVETGLETDYYTEIISNEISEGMTVYLSTPLVMNGSGNSEEEDRNALAGFFNGVTGSGNMPSGGDRGGNGGRMPSDGGGGMPSGGGPGEF